MTWSPLGSGYLVAWTTELIEWTTELAVAVMDEKPERPSSGVEVGT